MTSNELKQEMDSLEKFNNDNDRNEMIVCDDDYENNNNDYYYKHKHKSRKMTYEEEQIARGY